MTSSSGGTNNSRPGASIPLRPLSSRLKGGSTRSSSTTATSPKGIPAYTPGLFYSAASRAHDLGDLAAAKTLYTTALELDPSHVPSWIGRGVAHKEAGEYDAALKDYTRALSLATEDATTLVILSNRANCLTAQGAYTLALLDHNSALSLTKSDAVLWCNRGSTLMKLGRLEDAAADFRKALEVDQDYAVADYNLGLVYGRLGRIGDCVRQFQHAAQLFRLSSSNASHALDCERQIAYFTKNGTINTAIGLPSSSILPSSPIHATSAAPSSSSPFPSISRALSTPTNGRTQPTFSTIAEISPVSPVHKAGITRSFHNIVPNTVPSTTPSGRSSISPLHTPTSNGSKALLNGVHSSDTSFFSPPSLTPGPPPARPVFDRPQSHDFIQQMKPAADRYSYPPPLSPIPAGLSIQTKSSPADRLNAPLLRPSPINATSSSSYSPSGPDLISPLSADPLISPLARDSSPVSPVASPRLAHHRNAKASLPAIKPTTPRGSTH